MKSASIGLRVLALCSAVALGSGYVWWSQKKSEERRVRKEAFEELERAVLPGSKSAFMPGDGKVEVPGASGPGWKGTGWKGEEKKDPRTNADFIQETPADDEPRTMLPGSKRIDAILSPEDVEEKP